MVDIEKLFYNYFDFELRRLEKKWKHKVTIQNGTELQKARVM
jgi:hypothetical protein